jgi:hypothetical protein
MFTLQDFDASREVVVVYHPSYEWLMGLEGQRLRI